MTTASAGAAGYKQQIHDQLSAARPIPVGDGFGLSVVIGFRCGPSRNWINLWKPTIDALGPLLGEGGRTWNPRERGDRRFARHQVVDPALRWAIHLAVGVTTVPTLHG